MSILQNYLLTFNDTQIFIIWASFIFFVLCVAYSMGRAFVEDTYQANPAQSSKDQSIQSLPVPPTYSVNTDEFNYGFKKSDNFIQSQIMGKLWGLLVLFGTVILRQFYDVRFTADVIGQKGYIIFAVVISILWIYGAAQSDREHHHWYVNVLLTACALAVLL